MVVATIIYIYVFVYKELKMKGIDVLLDDVDENISNKFKKHDLLGIPFQIIIGTKSTNENFEFKEIDKESQMLNLNKIIQTQHSLLL